LAKLPSLKEKYKSDEEKLRDIACREVEIEMFRKYSEFYGYVFYVVQRKLQLDSEKKEKKEIMLDY
jgi:hypothetical protein